MLLSVGDQIRIMVTLKLYLKLFELNSSTLLGILPGLDDSTD